MEGSISARLMTFLAVVIKGFHPPFLRTEKRPESSLKMLGKLEL